jgi:hypothetical protein
MSRMLDGTKQQHATFWFDDGDLTLTLQHSFKLHAPLLFRNSRAFALWPTQSSDDQKAVNCWFGLCSGRDRFGGIGFCGLSGADLRPSVSLFVTESVPQGMSDTPPVPSSSYRSATGPHQLTTLASLLRVSSMRQLDSPSIYAMACARVEAMFPSGPRPFVHPPCLEMALVLAREYGITSVSTSLACPSTSSHRAELGSLRLTDREGPFLQSHHHIRIRL